MVPTDETGKKKGSFAHGAGPVTFSQLKPILSGLLSKLHGGAKGLKPGTDLSGLHSAKGDHKDPKRYEPGPAGEKGDSDTTDLSGVPDLFSKEDSSSNLS